MSTVSSYLIIGNLNDTEESGHIFRPFHKIDSPIEYNWSDKFWNSTTYLTHGAKRTLLTSRGSSQNVSRKRTW